MDQLELRREYGDGHWFNLMVMDFTTGHFLGGWSLALGDWSLETGDWRLAGLS
jgi:hypothetical protein